MLFSFLMGMAFGGEVVTAMPNEFSCYMVETTLLESRDSFTGRCDYDFEFVDAPRPETIRLALEDQRAGLDQCVRRSYARHSIGSDNSYELTIVILVDPKNIVFRSSGSQQRHDLTIVSATDSLQWSWNVDDCVEAALQDILLPEDELNGKKRKDPPGYQVVWHFASPQRARPLAPRTLPEFPRPQVLPGTSTFEDE